MNQEITPARILQVGMCFWEAKTLLSAIELGLFTVLAEGPLASQTLTKRLGLHPRSALDFFDALVSLDFLQRSEGKYANTPETDWYLDRKKSSYQGGFLEMANSRLYPFWADLTEGLRTGQPQNEAKEGGNLFEALYADPTRLSDFLHAMTGVSRGSSLALASQFPWHKYKTFVDVGTAQGDCAVQIALAHDHLSGVGFDLSPVEHVFDEYVIQSGLQGRLRFRAGDFFKQ